MPESAYEKARRLANESSLPGVDWDQYHDAKFDTLPENLKSKAFQAENIAGILRKHADKFGDKKTRLDEIEHPYSEQQDEIDASRSKLSHIVLNHPLPEGMELEHELRTDYGSLHHGLTLHKDGEEIGNLDWDGKTGHVGGLWVHPDHRPTGFPHLLEAAHALSQAYGHVGPTNSYDLSHYSYKLAKKFAPSFIPYGTSVEGIPQEAYDSGINTPRKWSSHEEIGGDINYLGRQLHEIDHFVPEDHPAKRHLAHADLALEGAAEAHDQFDHHSVAGSLSDMHTHLRNAEAEFLGMGELASSEEDRVNKIRKVRVLKSDTATVMDRATSLANG